MREIKFRAWDGVMHEDISMQVDYTYNGIKPQIAVVLMQYTGLKDKNGVEIYEGDIIEDNDGCVGKVIWDTWCWDIVDNSEETNDVAITDRGSIEVIGNIYENPKLLKGDN